VPRRTWLRAREEAPHPQWSVHLWLAMDLRRVPDDQWSLGPWQRRWPSSLNCMAFDEWTDGLLKATMYLVVCMIQCAVITMPV
jgi:hypothetical protein